MEGNPVPAVVADAVDRAGPAAPPRLLLGIAAGAGVVTLLGVLVDPARAAPALLVAAVYVLGMGLGGLTFVALAYVTNAGWSVAVRRVPEALAATIPLGAGLVLLALLFVPWLYEWSHADVVAADPLLKGKSAWLDTGFFWARALMYIAVWLVFARAILRTSAAQDLTGGTAATRRNIALSAGFLVAFAVTFSLASFDWLMSLEPHWFSTVYAVYNFSGLFVGALAAVVLVAIALRRRGPLAEVLKPDHLHDLGKLLFGFSTFWAYIWFCQYMLIWYANIPEETTYFSLRQNGAWGVLTVLNLVVNWLVPFLVLLPRPAKRSESVLIKVCVLLLLGRWLDLYQMVLPVHQPEGPVPTLWDASAMALGVTLLVLVLMRVLRRMRPVPSGDPYLEESLHHHA